MCDKGFKRDLHWGYKRLHAFHIAEWRVYGVQGAGHYRVRDYRTRMGAGCNIIQPYTDHRVWKWE